MVRHYIKQKQVMGDVWALRGSWANGAKLTFRESRAKPGRTVGTSNLGPFRNLKLPHDSVQQRRLHDLQREPPRDVSP